MVGDELAEACSPPAVGGLFGILEYVEFADIWDVGSILLPATAFHAASGDQGCRYETAKLQNTKWIVKYTCKIMSKNLIREQPNESGTKYSQFI